MSRSVSLAAAPRKPLVLVALVAAAFAINLDTTIVNVALPALVRQLHATDTQLQWVVDAYNLVFAALVLTSGSLSDRWGRKGTLLAGLATFGVASAAGALAASPAELIAARAVMGLGAAMIFPATLSLITNVFTGRAERAQAIGAWGASAGAAIAFGPGVGGWLLERSSWPAIFWAMVPVAALAAAPAAPQHHRDTRRAGSRRHRGHLLLPQLPAQPAEHPGQLSGSPEPRLRHELADSRVRQPPGRAPSCP